MANELSTRLTLDGSSFNQELENATQKVEKFQDVTSDATKSIQDLGNKGSRSTRELLTEINKISGAERSTSNYRRQLMQMQKDIQDLTINYRAMNSEMKNSSIGQETLSKINELTVKAGEYKDAINDAQQSIQRLASDTAMWDGMKQGIDTVSSGLQAFVAAGVLGEKSTEKLVAVIARLKAIEAATNAVIKIGNALQSNSALMMSISAVQARALAAAKNMEAAATGKATIAQKAFNVVAKANPYVLLATAIIAAVSAIALYTRHTEKARIEEEKQQKLVEKAQENYDEYKSAVSKAVGEITGKYKVLQTQYEQLKSEMEKTQFIKDNADEFEKLGLKINDINDADKVFITQSNQVIAALQARARAAAAQDLYQESFRKQLEAEIEAQKMMKDAEEKEIQTKATGPILPKEWREAGITKNSEYVKNNGPVMGSNGMVNSFELTPEGEQKIRNYYKSLAQAAGDELRTAAEKDSDIYKDVWVDAIDDAAQAIQDTGGLVTNPTTGGGKKGKEDVLTPGSLKEAQDKVAKLQEKVNNTNPNTAGFDKMLKDLEDAKAEVERIQKIINGPEKLEIIDSSSMKAIKEEINALQKRLEELDPNSEEFANVLTQLNAWKQRQSEINDLIKGTEKSSESILDKYRKASSAAAEVSEKLKIGLITLEEAQAEIQEINDDLKGQGITVPVKLQLEQESVETVYQAFDKMINRIDTVAGSISAIPSAVNATYSAFKNLGEALEECDNGWEAFFTVFQAGMQLFNTFTSIMSAVNTLMEMFNAATTTATTQTNADTAATTANTAAKSANATETITEAAAEGALTAMEGGKSVASIPFVGAVLAIAAIASIMAMVMGTLASAKGFATGGIVGGNSTHGDKVLARVNSKEMVITQGQQARLWNFINGGELSGNQNNVEFKIRGTDLIGVINNVGKKQSRI